MIKAISFKNYKAFSEGRIELKPITILLGANSVGKSSILQLLLMLQQTAETERYKSALKLHGEFASLGETANLLKDKDKSLTLSLSFDFDSKELSEYLRTDALKQLSATLIESYSYLQRFYSEDILFDEDFDFWNIRSNKRTSFRSFSINSKKQLTELINAIYKAKKELFAKKKLRENLFFSNSKDYWIFGDRIYNVINSLDEVEKTFDLLTSIQKIRVSNFSLSIDLKCFENNKDNYFKIICVTLLANNKTILKIEMKPDTKKEVYSEFKLHSDFYEGELVNDRIKNEFKKAIGYNSTIFSTFTDYDSAYFYEENQRISIFSNIILNIFSKATTEIETFFDRYNVNYVSPLRAHPKRYYFLDKANISTHLDTLDGDSLTEILKENDPLRQKVNKWLSNFGLTLNIDTLQDIIHIIKIKQNNLSLDITDVGFGISQVLPVIVQGFLSQDKSLTIIEQPEIHLHPKMQADLADLFIDIACKKVNRKIVPSKFLLIETHSEYLLKRLRRRMAERKKVNSENVAIYYFNPRNDKGTGIIDRKKINDTGFFEYPKDFYSGELLRDNTEFLKHQLKNK